MYNCRNRGNRNHVETNCCEPCSTPGVTGGGIVQSAPTSSSIPRPSIQRALYAESEAGTKRQTQSQVWAIVAEAFFSRLAFGLISFALPLYALHFGLSIGEIGVLTTLDTGISIMLKPLSGWASDRFGLKRSFTFAIILRSVVALLLAFAGAPWQLFAIRVVHGFSASLRTPSSSALLAECGGEKGVGTAFAWQHTATSIAGSIGKTVAGVLLALTLSNYSLVFGATFALSALPLAVVMLFVKEPVRGTAPVAHVMAVPKPRVRLSWQDLLPMIGFGFLVTGSAEMLNGLFPVLATQYAHLSESQIALIYLVSIIGVLFAGPFFGWLSDNVSRKLVLTLRSFANTLSSVIFLLFPTLLGIGAGKIADDLGKAAFRPAWGSLMTRVSSIDQNRRAEAMSWMTMGEDAGTILGPIIAGFLWSAWGLGIALVFRLALALLTELYTLALTNHSGEDKRAPVKSAGSAEIA